MSFSFAVCRSGTFSQRRRLNPIELSEFARETPEASSIPGLLVPAGVKLTGSNGPCRAYPR